MQLFPWFTDEGYVFLLDRHPLRLPNCRLRCTLCHWSYWLCYFWWDRWIFDSGCDAPSMLQSYTDRKEESSIARQPLLRFDRLTPYLNWCMRDRWDCGSWQRDIRQDWLRLCSWWNLFGNYVIEGTLSRDSNVGLGQFCGNGKIFENHILEHRLRLNCVEDCRWKIEGNLIMMWLCYFRSWRRNRHRGCPHSRQEERSDPIVYWLIRTWGRIDPNCWNRHACHRHRPYLRPKWWYLERKKLDMMSFSYPISSSPSHHRSPFSANLHLPPELSCSLHISTHFHFCHSPTIWTKCWG